jgi:hypothetical protein
MGASGQGAVSDRLRRGSNYLRVALAAIAATSLHACDGARMASPGAPVDLSSACELEKGAAFDGQVVRFRARFEGGVEHVRAFDEGCPRINLFLRADNPGVDLSLCSEKDMRFGCPFNSDLEVKATFSGVFRASKSDGGSVTVTSISDVVSEAERE